MSWWLSFARNKRMFIVNHEYFVHSNELKHDIGRGFNKIGKGQKNKSVEIHPLLDFQEDRHLFF